MTHHENLKILAFTGSPDETTQIIDLMTEKGYPKASGNDLVSQIEHLSDAGQHRIITDDADVESLKHAFPGKVTTISLSNDDHADSHLDPTKDLPEQLEGLVNELDFRLN